MNPKEQDNVNGITDDISKQNMLLNSKKQCQQRRRKKLKPCFLAPVSLFLCNDRMRNTQLQLLSRATLSFCCARSVCVCVCVCPLDQRFARTKY